MLDSTLPAAFARLDRLEVRLCLPVNATARFPLVRNYFAAVSRLGDGVAWYTLLAILPLLFGSGAVVPALHMALTGLAGVAIYKFLKQRLVRERPFHSHRGVRALVLPLDRYSFPSGHTLHAVSFTVMLAHYYPGLLWLVVPFAASVAVSRVVLGLHYPTDVLAGGLLGWLLAAGSLAFFAV
ncbi:MAG: phosphatase PAP2 family protein [Chromatiales bacterium]|nr:phosphatase PAP2 family protein [Chromatiales bacterium]